MSQTKKPQLKLDWCSHEAAKYAVEHWHYSRCLPRTKLVKIGVWEDCKFIGCLIFSWGATKDLVKPYGLGMTEGCELTRIALNEHKTPVSRILSIAIKMLKEQSPGLRLIVSFSDPEHGHHGGIYQATNWIFTGNTQRCEEYIYKGKRWQGRALRATYGTSNLPGVRKIMGSSKLRYLYPLDDEMKAKVLKLSKPYPKPRAVSIEGDASSEPTGVGSFDTITALPTAEEVSRV